MQFTARMVRLVGTTLVVMLASCGQSESNGVTPERPTSGVENEMEITGVVRYHRLEGGFYVIQADDGQAYNPTNLPAEFRQDGLPVVAQIRLRSDMMGIHQMGRIAEVIQIRKRERT